MNSYIKLFIKIWEKIHTKVDQETIIKNIKGTIASNSEDTRMHHQVPQPEDIAKSTSITIYLDQNIHLQILNTIVQHLRIALIQVHLVRQVHLIAQAIT